MIGGSPSQPCARSVEMTSARTRSAVSSSPSNRSPSPVGLDDPSPRNLIGCAVALADKLDSIVGCFAVGVVPTGSSDPFALRRAGLGMVKIILEKKLPLSLGDTIAAAAKALHSNPPKRQVTPEQEKQVLEFLLERAKFVFREKEGFSYDEVNAVFSAGAMTSANKTGVSSGTTSSRGVRAASENRRWASVSSISSLSSQAASASRPPVSRR